MAAAAAATTPGAGTGSGIAPATSRFAAACGALGQYVKAAERARAAVPVPVRRPLPLMPGADIPDGQEQREAGPAPAPLTIVYGRRVLVLGDVPADKAANLLRLALAATAEPHRSGAVCGGQISISSAADLPVARKASLQRFMEKRKGRVTARAAAAAPYRRPDGGDACPDDHLRLAL